MTATRLKDACGDHVHPETPGPVGDGGQDHPEQRQPGQLHPLAVGQAEQEPVDHDRQDDAGTPARRPSAPAAGRREQPSQGPEEQPAEEQLLQERRASTMVSAMTTNPPPCAPPVSFCVGAVEVVEVRGERVRRAAR